MAGKLRMATNRTRRSINLVRRIVVFRFTRINPGKSVFSLPVQLRNVVNNGEVIIAQRSTGGSIATPTVRYQFVNSATGLPVSNPVTVSGNRTVVLPFSLPAGTDRLKITNVGVGPVAVEGAILVF